MYKQIWWALALTGVVAAITGWWQGWDLTKSFTIGKEWLDSSVVGETVSQNKQAAQNFIGKVVEEQKQAALSSVGEAKGSLVAEAQQQAAAVLNSLEKSIGLKPTGAATSEVGAGGKNFALIITARVGEPVSFLVKNNTDAASDFTIDWGDGYQAAGQLSPNEEKIISHSWQTVGNHKITSDGREFVIRIIK